MIQAAGVKVNLLVRNLMLRPGTSGIPSLFMTAPLEEPPAEPPPPEEIEIATHHTLSISL